MHMKTRTEKLRFCFHNHDPKPPPEMVAVSTFLVTCWQCQGLGHTEEGLLCPKCNGKRVVPFNPNDVNVTPNPYAG